MTNAALCAAMQIANFYFFHNSLQQNMDYLEEYFKICSITSNDVYVERHHIVPKSLCPLLKNSKQNLVSISAYNHFKAHYFIWKWSVENNEKRWAAKMWTALIRMYKQVSENMTIEQIEECAVKFEEIRKNCSMSGSDNPMYRRKHKDSSKKLMSEKIRHRFQTDPSYRKKLMCPKSEEAKRHMRENAYDRRGSKNPMYGVSLKDKLSPEAYKQWKERAKRVGKANGNFGKTWIFITDGIKNKRHNKNDTLPEGWKYGMTKKKATD